MKKIICLLTSVLLCHACSVGDEDTASYLSGDGHFYDSSQNEASYGAFAIDWMVDQQRVDTATLYVDQQFWVSHFPSDYLHRQLFPEGTAADEPVAENHYTQEILLTGYSEAKLYYTVANTYYPYSTTVGQTAYEVWLYLNRTASVAVYDRNLDAWSGAYAVDSIELRRHDTPRIVEKTLRYQPQPLTLSYTSTKRKKR